MERVLSLALVRTVFVDCMIHAYDNNVYSMHKFRVHGVSLLKPFGQVGNVQAHLLRGLVSYSVRASVPVGVVRCATSVRDIVVRGVAFNFRKVSSGGCFMENEAQQ